MQYNWSWAASAADRAAPIADRGEARDGGQPYRRHDERHDSVTGLPRPRSFLDHLDRALRTPGRSPASVAMLLLRVTNLDALRARGGTPCCDEVLRIIAEGLHEAVPEPNLVTRLCGGDFAIVLRDLGPEVTTEALATRLLERVSEPFPSGDRLLRCAVVGALVAAARHKEAAIELLDRTMRALSRATVRLGAQEHRGLGRN